MQRTYKGEIMFKMSFLDEGFHRYKSLCIWDVLKHKTNYKTPILGGRRRRIGITKPRIINSFFHFNLNCILSYYCIDILEVQQVPGVICLTGQSKKTMSGWNIWHWEWERPCPLTSAVQLGSSTYLNKWE